MLQFLSYKNNPRDTLMTKRKKKHVSIASLPQPD